MYYEINVSKLNPKTGRYEHLFATAERSIASPWALKRAYAEIAPRFKEADGYKVTVERWEKSGHLINMETFEK